MHCNHVSVSEAGDYIQVIFEPEFDSSENYLLPQRGFEFEEIGGPQYYVETENEPFIGHNILEQIVIGRSSVLLKLNDTNKSEFSLTFNTSDENFHKVKRTLESIFNGFGVLSYKM